MGIFLNGGALLAAIFLLSGWGVALRSLLSYLRNGLWYPFSTLDALRVIWPTGWTENPQDWIGVHRLLEATPWWAGSVLMALLSIALGAWATNAISSQRS